MTNVSDLVIPRFHDVLGDVLGHYHSNFWLYGGRGSTKSSFISLCIVLLIVQFPFANCVVVRRFGNTLRDSVFQQTLWAVSALGLEDYFRSKISPMELTYLPTGQRIAFRGADDPTKLKGTVFSRGYCAITWLEEVDQFEGLEAVRSILNSLRRGGEVFWGFFSFNPPRTAWNWVNKETINRRRREDTLVRRSSYLDVVESHPEWLGGPFIEEAELLREMNEMAWRWEFLGEIVGVGGNIFTNVLDERISDERIRSFERVRCGIDWGWVDPWRFIICAWEPETRKLYIYEEHSATKTMPADTGRVVLEALTYADEPGGEPFYHDRVIWCDDTVDGKYQMNIYRRELGIRAHAARKGRMRKISYEWLASLRAIVIDSERCPLTFEEFTMKEYVRDKDGEWLDEIPDGNDHSIDAVRYAMMDDILRA